MDKALLMEVLDEQSAARRRFLAQAAATGAAAALPGSEGRIFAQRVGKLLMGKVFSAGSLWSYLTSQNIEPGNCQSRQFRIIDKPDGAKSFERTLAT